MHINPDHYLETPEGRVWSPERNKLAWETAYRDFEAYISSEENRDVVAYIVCGIQGSGKSTWVKQHRCDHPSVYFDAAMPAKEHRAISIEIAKAHARQVIAVWLDVPLDVALARNNARPAREIVPPSSIISVYHQLQPPEIEEGFDKIIIIDQVGGQRTIEKSCS